MLKVDFFLCVSCDFTKDFWVSGYFFAIFICILADGQNNNFNVTMKFNEFFLGTMKFNDTTIIYIHIAEYIKI